MSKNKYTREWALAQIEKRKAERGYDWYRDQEIPDPGPESGLQLKVLQHGKDNGWPVFHDRSRGVNEPGWSDNFFFLPPTCPHCKRGKIVLIELKSETGTFRKEQKEKRLILEYLGHKVWSARSFKRVVEIIQGELKGENYGKNYGKKGLG